MAGSIGRYGGHQLLAELPNVLRFGAAVGQDRHRLIDLGGGLQASWRWLSRDIWALPGLGNSGPAVWGQAIVPIDNATNQDRSFASA